MNVNIVSRESLLAQRRQGTFEDKVPFVINGELCFVDKKLVNGEMETYSLTRPIGEMITSPALRRELIEKVVLDVELGREEVPVLYKPIYDSITDPNLPELVDAKWVQYGVVYFMEHLEGGEVNFGHMKAEEGPTVRVITYAAGFEYTEDMEEYNKTFEMETLNKSFGEAYNALLNHIHFHPILKATYAAGNKTAAQGGTDDPLTLKVKKTLQKAVEDAATAKRAGTVLLASSARRYDIENALKEMQVNGTTYGSIGDIQTIIYYDGWDIQVGKKTYSYGGVPNDKAYLIRPRRGFKELVKHDLRIDSTMADLSRLVQAQVVGRARRGVFAAPAQNVQEITLPTT